jgi:hypothetical protein
MRFSIRLGATPVKVIFGVLAGKNTPKSLARSGLISHHIAEAMRKANVTKRTLLATRHHAP